MRWGMFTISGAPSTTFHMDIVHLSFHYFGSPLLLLHSDCWPHEELVHLKCIFFNWTPFWTPFGRFIVQYALYVMCLSCLGSKQIFRYFISANTLHFWHTWAIQHAILDFIPLRWLEKMTPYFFLELMMSSFKIKRGFGWLVVFNAPSIAKSFRDDTPIYCPLRRTLSSWVFAFTKNIHESTNVPTLKAFDIIDHNIFLNKLYH